MGRSERRRGAWEHTSRRRRLARKLAVAVSLSPRDLLATLHALALTSLVEVLLRFVPLTALARWCGVRIDTAPTVAADQTAPSAVGWSEADRRRLRAVRRVARNWPFGEGPCLRRSLVLGYLLRHRAPALRLGVARGDGGVRAHAWVEVEGVALDPERGFAPLRAVGSPGG